MAEAFSKELRKVLGFSSFQYRRPVDLGTYTIYPSPESHKGAFRHAVDIGVPDPLIQKTVVFSPVSGVIERVAMGNTIWGPTSEFQQYLNFVNIRPSALSLEFVEVAHLGPLIEQGVIKSLKVGDRVVAGEPIATVGINGWTTEDEEGKPIPHVHIMVGKWKDGIKWGKENNFQSLRIRWMKGRNLS